MNEAMCNHVKGYQICVWINYATAKCSSLNGSNDSARASIKIFGLCLCDNKKFKKSSVMHVSRTVGIK